MTGITMYPMGRSEQLLFGGVSSPVPGGLIPAVRSNEQNLLATRIPSLWEQECCVEPVSHCPVGDVTAIQSCQGQTWPNAAGTATAACPLILLLPESAYNV